MVAKSGDTLLSGDAVESQKRELLPLAEVVTPNRPEAEVISGMAIGSLEDARRAARQIHALGPKAVIIKGGHFAGPMLVNLLFDGVSFREYASPRHQTRHTHGTGCTMASAIATFLGRGDSLASAVERARTFVRVALYSAPKLGQGAGPVGSGHVRLDVGPGPRLNQVTLTVTDYAKSVHFYALLGLKQIVDSPENQYARFETAGGATLSIQADPEVKVLATTAVYLECDDLDAQVDRLARAGVPFEHAPRNQPWMWREARLRDPSGNIIFLYKAGEARRFPPWRVD
jgi:hydroxymethylpyrimidine/phosphomethylpyrimidine kinase